ncbi:hypothetical protein NP493_864g02036 [Ridgeia piscesae]|uniref:Uncharacterized protein n=1 Tax=Ridgeia piscesae TaxID=27915 RepID=A0AAD9NMB4_RIDPI|nr:hypothetical protein NP493_864g02036 [Ridgeia piscesae]
MKSIDKWYFCDCCCGDRRSTCGFFLLPGIKSRARLTFHAAIIFINEASTASHVYSNSTIGVKPVTSRVSTTFAHQRPGFARRRQRASIGAHATAAIEADGPPPSTRQRGARVIARETRHGLPRIRVMYSSTENI